MKKYTIEELKNPELYKKIPELASIAKTAANNHFESGKFNMGRGDFSRAILAGQFPELVKPLWDKKVDHRLNESQKKQEGITFCETFTAPEGYTLEIDNETVLIKGPYCSDLGKRLNKIGFWDGLKHKNRKCFVIPLENAKSLKRIFSNWQKGRAVSNVQANITEIEKWLGYVEAAAKEGRLYQNGLDKLSSLNIKDHPELDQKLKTLVDLAKETKKKEEEKPKYGQSWSAEKIALCSKCKTPVNVGDHVRYKYQSGNKSLEHVACDQALKQKQKREAEAPFKLSGGSGYYCNGWAEGEIVQSTEKQRENGYPEFLYVVESRKQYYKYDGLSFGVGDDSGYLYFARCRQATEEESKSLKEEIAAKKIIQRSKEKLLKLKKHIQEIGEYPQEKGIILNGDVYLDTQTIYGGGDWFVVDSEWIWYVKNNGMDGDDWSRNNIRTGGAGAIGWRTPFDENVYLQLIKLSEILD
ncbi:MAG: hypothetical protein KKG99_17450 [Bacteroidetes bacterium]|nr:hypothetical protein [Bacteroidota bacterium]